MKIMIALTAGAAAVVLSAAQTINLFAAMDADRSGSISQAELEGYFIDAGQTAPEDLFNKEDRDGNGEISFDEFSGPKGEDNASGQPQETAQASAEGQDPTQNIFFVLDVDGDWYISKQEFNARLDDEALWTSEDKDNDGRVSWDEFSGSKGLHPDKGGREQRQRLEQGKRNLFAELDANQDQFVDEDEFFTQITRTDEAIELFRKDDHDGDGRISRAEFSGPKGDEPTTDTDTVVSSSTPASSTEGSSSEVNVFNVLDQDKDGLVSYVEYFQVLEDTDRNRKLFAKEDKDNNGYITWAEFDGSCETRLSLPPNSFSNARS